MCVFHKYIVMDQAVGLITISIYSNNENKDIFFTKKNENKQSLLII